MVLHKPRGACTWLPHGRPRGCGSVASHKRARVRNGRRARGLARQRGTRSGPISLMPSTAATRRAPAPPAEIEFEPARAVEYLGIGLRSFTPLLCSRSAALPPQQTDDWTCGHLNLAALLRSMANGGSLERPLPPKLDAEAILALLRAAWAEGFDENRPPLKANGWIGAWDMASVLLHLRLDARVVDIVGDMHAQGDSAEAQRGVGAAVHAAACACLAERGPTSSPILLQDSSHSRTLLGVTMLPPRLILRDPEDPDGTIRCVSPESLDGQQFQLVLVRDRGADLGRLSDAQALGRRRPAPHAQWMGRSAGWRYHEAWSWPIGELACCSEEGNVCVE